MFIPLADHILDPLGVSARGISDSICMYIDVCVSLYI